MAYGQLKRFLATDECRWSENTVRRALRGDNYIREVSEIRQLANLFIEKERQEMKLLKRRAV